MSVSKARKAAGSTSRGFFAKASGTDARYGVFTDIGGDLIIHTNNQPDNSNILSALKPVYRGGFTVPRCLAGTRRYIFKEIDRWLTDLDSSSNILWIGGNPGSGKSSIASSLAYQLTLREQLGSSFFFRRGDIALTDPATLWRTVAWDLARHDHVFASNLVQVLDKGKVDLERSDIDLNFKLLIEEPMIKTYRNSTPHITPVIIIDALDECCPDPAYAGQRKAFLNTFVEWSRLPKYFKLIVTSRDEHATKSLRTTCKQITLPTGGDVTAEVNRDILHFFQVCFSELDGSSPEWPGKKILHDLTARAAGLFIYAETVVGCIKQGLPFEQLERVLAGDLGADDNLTKLYRQYLNISFQGLGGRTLEVFKIVVSTVVLAKSPFHRDDLHQFLSQSKANVWFILDKLSSVISIGGEDKRIRVGHLSFAEFLCDPNRCPKEYVIDREKESCKIALACLQRMKEGLRFNICDLETSYVSNVDVEKLEERIQTKIPSPLAYSCHFWAVHLRETASAQSGVNMLLEELKDFFHIRLLYWLEVASLLKSVSEANIRLFATLPWIEALDTDLSNFARDASRFIINFHIPISISVPHIYLSALSFAPSTSLVGNHYRIKFPNTILVTAGQKENWPPMVNLLQGHTGPVRSIAFSQDGTLIASGSEDRTIRVWDVNAGEVIVGPFEGHRGWVNSVSFSPDGTRVASGSDDQTIIIWDIDTGEVSVGPFVGHTGEVNAVSFSPDGKHVASGSKDWTLRIWNAQTGDLIREPFEGHTNRVNSVSFSPDGKRIASGSSDDSILIWDVETGVVAVGPIMGHNGWVHSVSFSPDGACVVSGAFDKTMSICVWDAKTGEAIAGPFDDHNGFIHSVSFSPDSKLIVSGSIDQTIRIWDLETGKVIANPFEGHTDAVNSALFSPDGNRVVSCSDDRTICVWEVKREEVVASHYKKLTSGVLTVSFLPDRNHVVSGSDDNTICVWDVESGGVIAGPFPGHTDRVNSVSCSSDGKYIASGSGDCTVRVWDIEISYFAMPIRLFQGHKDRVNSVAFSPDGNRVASGSHDETIRVWDVEAGCVVTVLTGGYSGVNSVSFSPDGRHVVTGAYDRTVRVWDVEAGGVVAGPFKGHTLYITSVLFAPNGKCVVSGSSDGTIRLWNIKAGKAIADPLEGHTAGVNSISFSPDGKYIASSSYDQTIVWNVETRKVVAGPFEGHLGHITSVSFSPDGRYIVTGAYDGTIRVWNVEAFINPSHHTTSSSSLSTERNMARLPMSTPDGWVPVPDRKDGDERLLFWVPAAHRRGICGDETMVIFGGRTTRLDRSRFEHGTSWTKCRRADNDTLC